MADGTITFSTALDNKQLEKDLKDAERDVDSLKKKLDKADRDKGAVEQEMERAREAVKETAAEVERLQDSLGAEGGSKELAQRIREAEREAEALTRRLAEKTSQRSAVEEQMDRAIAKEQEAIAKIEELEARVAELRAGGDINGAEELRAEGLFPAKVSLREQDAEIEGLRAKWEGLGAEVGEYERQVREANAAVAELQDYAASLQGAEARLKEQERELSKIETRWDSASRKVEEYTRDLEAATGKAEGVAEEYQRATSGVGPALRQGMREAEDGFDRLGKRITGMVRRVFVLQVALSSLRGVRSMISEALMENERLSASVAGLKAAFQGVASYVANAVAPAITGVVNAATGAITALARLVDSVFGTSIVASIAKAREAAESAWRQSDAASSASGRQAKAAKKLAKAQDQATKSVMGFDEINALNADDTDAAADALGDEAGVVGDGLKPDWDALDVGKIDAKLSEIMLILGAALMAVGAILAFSGINIPLGLTLMVIGALMVYSAYQENWDALPEQVRSAITGVLVVTGIVLLCLGAVLAFSGPQGVPIGIGMMAAGAAMLWTAVALNWKSMSDSMKVAVSAVMAVVSVALLAIGAIIAFSNPAAAPLGIALMVAGAASLAATVAINWKSMPKNVQGVVSAILSLLGGALLVVGAILALSGAGAALGVGLMLAGAVTLATAAALNWSSMPDEVRDVVSVITGIVSVAFIVVGAILCFSMANVPLGIALIAAGMAGAVTVAKINWNFILEKLRSAWDDITSWFRQNVERVLTSSFWNDKFKPIANGIISALNAALSGVGWFVNSVASGVSSVLDWFGVTGWSFSITMPQIPYLAQGAVIPPNREFLAVLGDQRSGNNIEAPEDLMRQIVREEAGSMLADAIAALGQGGGSKRDVVLVVGHTELARATLRGISDLNDTGELGRFGLSFA